MSYEDWWFSPLTFTLIMILVLGFGFIFSPINIPDYDTGKELLLIVLDITGIIFSLGGVFAVFILKNAYDFKEKIITDSTRTASMNKVIINVIILMILFFLLLISAVAYSFVRIATLRISAFLLGQIFGCVIGSLVDIAVIFVYLSIKIERIGIPSAPIHRP